MSRENVHTPRPVREFVNGAKPWLREVSRLRVAVLALI
jgi:hypothetical protein